MEQVKDEVLVEQALGGDRPAWDALYLRHRKGLHAYLRRFASDDGAAEDLVQETFLRVMRYAASFDSHRSFRGWLFSIARNVGLASRHGPSMEALEDVILTAPDHPGREYRMHEALSALEAALQELPEADREVLVLGKIQGRSYREIGRKLGITEGAVKVRVFRALQRLRSELRQRGNPGGWLDEH